MNAADVAYALNLDLDAISKRLHDPAGPHMQDIETILYALHSLREHINPPAKPDPCPDCPDCLVRQGNLHTLGCPARARNIRAFEAGRWPLPRHVDLEAEEEALGHFAADRTPG